MRKLNNNDPDLADFKKYGDIRLALLKMAGNIINHRHVSNFNRPRSGKTFNYLT